MLNEIGILRDFIKQHRLRWTVQRKTVLEVFLEMNGHVSVEELFEAVQKTDLSIGIATVYRTVALMVECGLARENISLNGGKSYEKLYREGHHDHLSCISCGKLVEFEHPLIEKLQLDVCQQHNFALSSHRMNLYGLCAICREGKTG
jgi:Fur family ferric uptake transcriptional regulator